jgi:hypothetical protein
MSLCRAGETERLLAEQANRGGGGGGEIWTKDDYYGRAGTRMRSATRRGLCWQVVLRESWWNG